MKHQNKERRYNCITTIASAVLIVLIFLPEVSGNTPAAGSAAKAEWNLWRGPNRNGISDETDWDPAFLKKPLKLNWKIKVGAGFSSVSISGNNLYTMGYDGRTGANTIFCLAAETGKKVWSYSYRSYSSREWMDGDKASKYGDHMGPRSTPVVFENKVYTFGQDGDILCNDALTGKLIWHRQVLRELDAFPPTWMFSSSIHIEGKMAVVNAGHAGLALNRENGEIIWFNGKGIGNYSTPVAYEANGKARLAIFGQESLYGIDPDSGKILWDYPWKTNISVNGADPVVWKSGILLIISIYEAGCALIDVSTDSPVTLWRNKNLKTQYKTPVLIGDYIYGIDQTADAPGKISCIDIKNGSVRWSVPFAIEPGLTAANGYLIVLNERGDLRIVKASPAKYTEISAKSRILSQSCITAPVLCRSSIFIRNSKGDLISIDASYKRVFGLRNLYYSFVHKATVFKSLLNDLYNIYLNFRWATFKNINKLIN